jgi:diguanylate cyclase (GGDEF)-like protein
MPRELSVEEKFISVLTGALEQLPRAVLYLSTFVLVAALGIADFFTGFELSFAFFYLLPVALAAWTISRLAGFLFSFVSAATWVAANFLAGERYSSPLVPFWNSLTRLGFFLVVALLLSSLRRLLEHERSLARTDFLTGTLNRRAFFDRAAIELARAGRYRRPFTLVYLDLDNFKVVNDHLGHGAGDDLLQAVARTVSRMIRTVDLAARLGGDEFAVLLPETDKQAARKIVSRLHQALLKEARDHGCIVTFSIGALTCRQPPDGVEELLHRADTLMYAVKSSGKNSVSYALFSDPG